MNPGAGSATNELRGETGRVTSGTSEHRAFSVQGLFNRQEVIDARYGTGLVTNTPVSAESSTIVSQSFLSGIESSFEAELSEIEEGLEDTQQQEEEDEENLESQPQTPEAETPAKPEDSEEEIEQTTSHLGFSEKLALVLDSRYDELDQLQRALVEIHHSSKEV